MDTQPSTSAAPTARPSRPPLRERAFSFLALPFHRLLLWLRTDSVRAEWKGIGETAWAIAHGSGRGRVTVDDLVIICLRDPAVVEFLAAFGHETARLEVLLTDALLAHPRPPDEDAEIQDGERWTAYQNALSTTSRDRKLFDSIDRVGLLMACLSQKACLARGVFDAAGIPSRRLLRALLQTPPSTSNGLLDVVVINDDVSGSDAVCNCLLKALSLPHHVSHPLMELIHQEGRAVVFTGERSAALLMQTVLYREV